MAKKTTTKKLDTEMEDFRDFHIAVVIEWDGQPPRMTWYDHLHRMGIYARGGNREEFESPLARRASLDRHGHRNGIVFQEGLYLCRNDSIAMQLADQAKRFGATNILQGKIFLNEFTLDEKDIAVLEALHQRMSKRGRRSKEDAGTYTITCLSELDTFEAQLDSVPMTCPSCASFRFYQHPGKRKVFQTPNWEEVQDLWDYWLRSRFTDFEGRAVFEIPQFVKPNKKELALLPPEVAAVQMDEPVAALPARVKLTPELRLKIWDACFALSKLTDEDRIQGRLMVIGALQNITDENGEVYLMSTPEEGYDIIDLCILMKHELGRYL